MPSSPSSPFVTTINIALAKKLTSDLQAQGFELSQPEHTIFSAKKKGVSCTLYKSGKLMVQGKEAGEFLEFYLEPEILGSFKHSYGHLDVDTSSRIGIDESGKGDFFGPLCIAGVYGDEKSIAKLQSLGVKDSKLMTDTAIIKLATAIKTSCVHRVVKINPKKYNELYEQFKNLNTMLAWGHATAIELLVKETSCRNVIIDQFANERVVLTALKRKDLQLDLTQRHRAEEDLVVAAASILARDAFLEGLSMLGREFGLKLPKGASKLTIEAGRDFVRKHGREMLENVAKLHFKTTAVL